MVMKGASSLGEVVMNKHYHHHHQYASTPHLFVFQTVDDDEDEVDDSSSSCNTNAEGSSQKSSKEPIYSSAIEVRKESQKQEMEAVRRLTEKYDTIGSYTRPDSYSPPEDPLAVTEDDVARIETFFRGNRTQVWICRTMANLYNETGSSTGAISWQLRFTGVPLLLLDGGDTKSRSKRQLQLILAEKGTGFALWRDVVDNLTSYRVQEPHFHTFYLSSDHRQRLGLSYNDGKVAMEFHTVLEQLISDPANISLSGPGKKKKEKPKEKPAKYKPPKKTDISLPCNFNHITNVDPTDRGRFFSLQLFSRKPTSHPVQPNAMIEKLPLPDEPSLKQRVIQV